MTIRSLLEEHTQKCPDAVALRFCEDKQWRSRTYAEFLGDVGRTASAYGEGFALRPREENAALILSNSPTWMEVYLACSGAGVAVVPIDPKLHNDEVAYILGDSGAVVVTTDAAHLDMMRAIVPADRVRARARPRGVARGSDRAETSGCRDIIITRYQQTDFD